MNPTMLDSAVEKLSPEIREILVRSTARANFEEDDPLYVIILAQAEMFSATQKVPQSQDHLPYFVEAFEQMATSQRETRGKLDADNDKILKKLSLLINAHPEQKLKRWVIYTASGILAAIIALSLFLGMKIEEGSANARVAQANQ